MNRFLAFIRKEIRHIIRDKRTLLILFGMPVAQVMIFGYALNNEIKDAGLVVLDFSGDHETLAIKERLEASEYFHLVSEIKSEQGIGEAFRLGEAKLAIVFPEDFASKLNNGENPAVKLTGDASDPNQAQVLVAYASAIIQTYVKSKRVNEVPGPVVIAEPRMVFNPELKAVFMFVPGVMGMVLMLVAAMMTSLAIAREKELGMMELLLVSPLKPIHIILGKVTPYWFLSFFNAMVIVSMGIFVFQMPLNGSLLILILACLLYSITGLALGIFISARSGSQMTAMFFSMFALLMPTMLLSGFIFPIENMPLPLRIISNIIPARWFIEIIKGVMIKGSDTALLIKPFSVLLLITVVLLVAGIRSVKNKIE